MKTQKPICDDIPSPLPSPNVQPYPSSFNYPTPFFTAYGPKVRQQLHMLPGEGRTKQSFKAEADINNIMARYQKTGVLDFMARHEPQYADCTGLEFEAGMQLIARAKSMFEDLPSSLRARFENSPAKFLDFCHDEKNLPEMRTMGLVKPEAPTSNPPSAPPTAATAAGSGMDRRAIRKAAREAGERAADENQDQLPT